MLLLTIWISNICCNVLWFNACFRVYAIWRIRRTLVRLAIRVSTVAFAFLRTADRFASVAPAIMKAHIARKVSK